MTNQDKINALKEKLKPLQEKLFGAIKQASKDVSDKINESLKPEYLLTARVGIESISFMTTSEADSKNVNPPYADFGSEITIYNHFNYSDFANIENQFTPELNYSSLGMKFTDESKKYQVSKFHALHFISSEILKDGEFAKFLRKTFHDLRVIQKEVWAIESEISPLIEEEQKKEKLALKEAFEANLKKENWYKTGENFYHVESLTPKKMTILTYKKTKFVKEVKTTRKEGIDMLFNKELTESPFVKQ